MGACRPESATYDITPVANLAAQIGLGNFLLRPPHTRYVGYTARRHIRYRKIRKILFLHDIGYMAPKTGRWLLGGLPYAYHPPENGMREIAPGKQGAFFVSGCGFALFRFVFLPYSTRANPLGGNATQRNRPC